VKTILACRNEILGISAAKQLQSEGFDAEYRNLDISNSDNIQVFYESINKEFGKLDILINNAAIAFKNSDPTPFQAQAVPTMLTNYFGTTELTLKLLPLLRNSNDARIVFVASEAGHLRIFKSNELKQRISSETLTIEELNQMMNEFVKNVQAGQQAKNGWPNTCYGTSKAAVIALTKILAKHETKMIVNCCCPGYCATDMSSHMGPKSAEDGAVTPVFLALDLVGQSGIFFSENKEIEW
jgi:carbonyl reductase 1